MSFVIEDGVLKKLRNDPNKNRNIVVPDGVNEIKTGAFSYNNKIKSVVLSDSVRKIGASAFAGCSNLTKIKLNDGLEIIERDAFKYCQKLVEINIPDSVTLIQRGVFLYCDKLENINVSEGNNYYSSKDGILYDKGYKTLKVCPVTKTSAVLPKETKTVGKWSFYKCRSLTHVFFNEALETIDKGAFSDCLKLDNAIIPDTVSKIGESAFQFCESLRSVTFPKRVSTLQYAVLWGTDQLNDFVILSKVRNFDNVLHTENKLCAICCPKLNLEDALVHVGSVFRYDKPRDIADNFALGYCNHSHLFDNANIARTYESYISHHTKRIMNKAIEASHMEAITFLLKHFSFSYNYVSSLIENCKENSSSLTALLLDYINIHFTEKDISRLRNAKEKRLVDELLNFSE